MRVSKSGGGVCAQLSNQCYLRVIILYLEYQSVCPFVLIGSPSLTPLWNPRGEGKTRWRVRERGEPIQTTGEKAWHSVSSVSATHGTDTNPGQHPLRGPAQDSHKSVVRVSEDCKLHPCTCTKFTNDMQRHRKNAAGRSTVLQNSQSRSESDNRSFIEKTTLCSSF